MAIDPKFYQQLLETFQQELKEQHQVLISGLLAIESANSTERQAQLQILFRASHNIKGAAKSVSLDDIAAIGHELEDKFSQWKIENAPLKKSDIDYCMQQADGLLESLKKHLSAINREDAILKIPLSKIENANTKADEFIAYRLRFENWMKMINQCIGTMSDAQKILTKKDNTSTVYFSESLSSLKTIADNSGQFLGEFSRSLQNLQDDLRIMRLVPIATILKPLDRVVRALSNSMNKKVSLIIEGDDIEIDKPILDHLKDPLQHLVRNAIDHGIETLDERKKLGKPSDATLRITVQHDAGKIKIIFNDDGRGLDIENLKIKILEMGLSSKEILAKLNDTEIVNFIFRSGFTTKSNITELSGRGVGLDVVKTNIESVKGNIFVESKKNSGTTFILSLPLTMATTRGVFFKIDDQQFMVPTISLQALYEIKLSDLKPVEGELTFLVDEIPVPIKFLRDILKINHTKETRNDFQGILIQEKNYRFLILIDAIENEHDCVIKPLPAPFNQMPLFIGVTLTDIGKSVPVLNPKVLLQLASIQPTILVRDEKLTKDKSHKKRILVVDDSLTTRSLAVHSLNAAGFSVQSVNNGLLAWESLKKTTFDCVITDIEMPEMDGFELTTRIKSDEKLKSLTVIIVSAHESEEDKKRGLTVGADAYLVKSQFDTHALINMIERLI